MSRGGGGFSGGGGGGGGSSGGGMAAAVAAGGRYENIPLINTRTLKGEENDTSRNNNKERSAALCPVILSAVIVMFTAGLAFGGTSKATQQTEGHLQFPEEAVKAIVTAARNNDDKELIAIFGPSAKDLIFSGDRCCRQTKARAVSEGI